MKKAVFFYCKVIYCYVSFCTHFSLTNCFDKSDISQLWGKKNFKCDRVIYFSFSSGSLLTTFFPFWDRRKEKGPLKYIGLFKDYKICKALILNSRDVGKYVGNSSVKISMSINWQEKNTNMYLPLSLSLFLYISLSHTNTHTFFRHMTGWRKFISSNKREKEVKFFVPQSITFAQCQDQKRLFLLLLLYQRKSQSHYKIFFPLSHDWVTKWIFLIEIQEVFFVLTLKLSTIKYLAYTFWVCHGFRLMKQDDYFRVTFDQLCSSKNWVEPKTVPQ